jgi:hypothetical protein
MHWLSISETVRLLATLPRLMMFKCSNCGTANSLTKPLQQMARLQRRLIDDGRLQV